MEDKYEKLSTGRRWATPAYYRFSIPWITKKKKAIYLDSDLLIRKDIKNLFDIDLEEYCYAAVVDGSANENHILPNLEGNITIEKGNYYNSGVLLLNCDKIRKEMPATFANLLLKQEILSLMLITEVCLVHMKIQENFIQKTKKNSNLLKKMRLLYILLILNRGMGNTIQSKQST